MRISIFIIVFFSSSFLLAQADYATQRSVSAKVLNWYDTAFRNASSNNFSAAERDLLLALKKEPDFLDARLLLANVYYEKKQYQEAEKEFEYVLKIDPSFNYRVYYNLALTEKKAEKYKEAIEHLEDFLNTDPDERMKKKAKGHLEIIKFLDYAYAHPVPFEPENLGAGVNTTAHEYLPSFTADGKNLIFTRNERRNEDFYSAQLDTAQNWTNTQPLSSINTPENEGAQTMTADGNFIIFTACNREKAIGSCDLYFSTREGGVYSPPQLMPEPINTPYWESQPSLTPNGDALYFASNRPGSIGKKDIFVSYRINGNWTRPRNLGASINTPEDDVTPFIHADGQTLYFTSEGHPGLGKKDLFYSRWQAQKRDWGKPTNFGIPINTAKDEGTLTVSLNGKTAYFASDREDFENAQGGVDLYKFDLYEAARPKDVTYVQALVTDALTGQPLSAEVDVRDLTKDLPYVSTRTNQEGTFLIVMTIGKNYGLSVDKEGYIFHSENFALEDNSDAYSPVLLEIALTPIQSADVTKPEMSKPVILKNIFFETGSAELLPISLSELDRLKSLLEENPNLRIQINGHTDNVGSEVDNLNLSTARAKSVYDWLIEQNITQNRLRFKGFGESQAIADNETSAGRRTNRRTEFVIW